MPKNGRKPARGRGSEIRELKLLRPAYSRDAWRGTPRPRAAEIAVVTNLSIAFNLILLLGRLITSDNETVDLGIAINFKLVLNQDGPPSMVSPHVIPVLNLQIAAGDEKKVLQLFGSRRIGPDVRATVFLDGNIASGDNCRLPGGSL